MITCFFGVPGVGKNTLLAKFARREFRRQKLSKYFPFISHYDHIYTDFFVDGAEQFKYEYFRTYKMYNSLILLEEMSLYADNRKFKSFTDEERDFYTLHRHLGCDIIYATQDYSKVDSKVRSLTQELWYMSKTVVPLLKHFTAAKRIYRCVTINEHSGDLTLGYRFCNLIESLFVSNFKLCFRPFYYKFFDSYAEGSLEERPELCSTLWASGESDPKRKRTLLTGIATGWKKIQHNQKKEKKENRIFLGVWGNKSNQKPDIRPQLNALAEQDAKDPDSTE